LLSELFFCLKELFFLLLYWIHKKQSSRDKVDLARSKTAIFLCTWNQPLGDNVDLMCAMRFFGAIPYLALYTTKLKNPGRETVERVWEFGQRGFKAAKKLHLQRSGCLGCDKALGCSRD
jgi:hypothetical protein